MIKLEINLFGLSVYLNIAKVPKNADKRIEHKVHEEYEETPIYEDNPIENLFDESEIAKIANQFQDDLKNSTIYNIPSYSDVPKRYQIQDDVEIITDEFEKEVEDIIEGKR